MDDTDPLTNKDAKWIMAEFTETLSNTNLSNGVIHQTVRKVLESINLFRETKMYRKDIEIFLKTYVGDKPRRGKRYKSMWDLTIITKWAEITYNAKEVRTLQRRALILTMIFRALRPAELERMRRETMIVKDNTILTQVRTKTLRGEVIKVIINKHTNLRIDAIDVLQRLIEFTKTTFKDEQVWFDIEGSRPANLQKIKEELTAILRENEIPETFTAFSIVHAVITHLTKQQDPDLKVINAHKLDPGDNRWISTPGGEENKPDRSGDTKEGTLEIAEADTKNHTDESPKAGFEEGKKPMRKRSKGRKKLLSEEGKKSETVQSRSSTPRRPGSQRTPSIIPNNICELMGEKDSTPLKKRGKDRRKRNGRSIGQIGDSNEEARARPMSPQRDPKRERV